MAVLGEPRDPKGFFQSKPFHDAEKPNQPCPSPEGVFWKLPSVPVGVALQHPGGCIPHTPAAIPAPLSCQNKRDEAQHLQIHTKSTPQQLQDPSRGWKSPPSWQQLQQMRFTIPRGKITSRGASLTAWKCSPAGEGQMERGRNGMGHEETGWMGWDRRARMGQGVVGETEWSRTRLERT